MTILPKMDEKLIELNNKLIKLDSDNNRLKQLIAILEQMSIDLMPFIIKCKCDCSSANIKTKLNVLKQKYENLNNIHSIHHSINDESVGIDHKVKSCAKIMPGIIEKERDSVYITSDQNDIIEQIRRKPALRRRGRPTKFVTNAVNNNSMGVNQENIDKTNHKPDNTIDDVVEKQKVLSETTVDITKDVIKRSKKSPKVKINSELRAKIIKDKQKANRHELKVICDWPKCGKRFRDTYDLKFHMWRHTGQKLYRCDWPGCEKEFSSRYLLKHQKSHLDPRRFQCLYVDCNQSFETSAELNQHFIDSHNGEKPFKCEFANCDQQFTNRALLKQHHRWCHSGITFKCEWPGCEERFRRKYNLKEHMDTKHAGKCRYVCDWPGCEFKSGHSRSFSRHKMVHTGEKPYPCEWHGCEWKFRQQHQLKAHMLTHTGESPVSCDFTGCLMRFKTRRVMLAHVDRVHKLTVK